MALKRVKMTAAAGAKDGFPVTALRETNILLALAHPNIVRLMGVCVERGHLAVFTEFASRGNLRESCEFVVALRDRHGEQPLEAYGISPRAPTRSSTRTAPRSSASSPARATATTPRRTSPTPCPAGPSTTSSTRTSATRRSPRTSTSR
mgnify:CR=1 FL=1